MFNRTLTTLAALASITSFLLGCATPTKMAFESESDVIASEGKPVFLMTATLKNSYRASYQPKLLVVNVERKEAKDSNDRLNFTMDEKAKLETDTAENGNSYLLRMELEDGDYVIRGLTGFSGIFPVRGTFFAPLHAETKSNGTGIFYLGHVTATVRERKENEFKAGPSIPLIDQAVTGFSGGTFDIEITDQLEKDEPVFKSKFTALRNVNIQKAILPSFDRAKAQQWWEAN